MQQYQRSPILDRLTFHERRSSQHASECVDKYRYYANVKIWYDSCGFDLDISYRCLHGGCNGKVALVCNDCGEAVDIGSRFRQWTLRDRLIFGLQDQSMQKEVLKEKLGDLTLHQKREICRSHEGSTKTKDKM